MKYLMLLSVLFAFNVKAQTEMGVDDLAAADEAIQSPALNIEGKYKVEEPVQEVAPAPAPAPVQQVRRAPKPAPKQLTSSDRLRLLRQRLEERNRIMVEKKMEQIRFQQEMALARQLEQSMNQTIKAIDNVK